MCRINSLNIVKINLFIISLSFLVSISMSAKNEQAEQPESTLYELISMTPQLSVFHGLVEVTDLADRLHQQGPFTLFIPTDEAFNQLEHDVLQAYMDDEEALLQLLTNHIYQGELYSDDFEYGHEVEMMSGKTIVITPGNVGFELEDAYLLQVDINASNGIIHVLNQVISKAP